MTLATGDLGVLGNLAVALGVFTPAGDPNPSWFGNPEASLENILANSAQRDALIAFVDEAMGGADRDTDVNGVVWLPIIELEDPQLTVAVTVNDSGAAVDIGVGLSVRTASPVSRSTLSVPLFRAQKQGGPAVATPFLLGSPGARIRLGTAITISAGAPAPGAASLGAIGIDIDVPTSPSDPKEPVFGLSLTDFQLPGATAPRSLRVAADGADELDDALLDLVLSLVKAQADAAAVGSAIAALGGLLGLRSGDAIPDFPIAALASQGLQALAQWVHGIVTSAAARADWLGYIAQLLGGARVADAVRFDVGGDAELTLELRADTGPTGNLRLTPALGVELGGDRARLEAEAELFQIDLVTGTATALPRLGVWAAAGRAGQRVLDVSLPTVARADTLRLGFALDAQRRLTFVLAADAVVLGAHSYPTLDLSSPNALMDALGNTVSDVANQLLGSLGSALGVARQLLGLDAPSGITAVALPAFMGDPVAAVSGYWHALISAPAGAVTSVLGALRDAIADAGQATVAILGSGTSLAPWRVPLIGPLELEVFASGSTLSIGIAASTRVDTLGQRCTVVETRFAAQLAVIDLAARKASLLPGVEAVLSARERGVNPPRVTLGLGAGATLTASGVGLRLAWSPAGALTAAVEAPNLTLATSDFNVPVALPAIAADGSVTLPAAGWDGVEALVGYLGELLGGFFGELVAALGWHIDAPSTGGDPSTEARLRLADLVVDPAAALAAWLPQLALSDSGPRALALFADLFAGAGASRGFIVGTGHPDDPYRLALGASLPNVAVWFPPAGLAPRTVQAPEAVQRWRPGDPGLDPEALAAALRAEAEVAGDVRDLITGRDVAGGLRALAERWTGGDGRIVPPESEPDGIAIDRAGVASGQLLGELDLEDLTGRIPTTTVYVALGAAAWPAAPAGRRIDLSARGLEAAMFAVPAAAVGDWFVALGRRADSRLAASSGDGTSEQAGRLARVLDNLAGVSTDVAIVAVAGAGHAARLAAQAQPAVTDLVTLGTPLGPIALTALGTQPTADALRLLQRLLPLEQPAADVPEDEDLALGRALVGSLLELAGDSDPSAELRLPSVPPEPPRAGLAVSSVFGVVTGAQVSRAITAIVASGLAERARVRAATPLPAPTGVHAGLRLVVAPTTSGSVSVDGDALLQLFAYDTATGIDAGPTLRLRLRVADRLGWLTSTPDLELRMVTADVRMPLDGTSHGEATLTLHDARVFGQSWERLVIGAGAGAVPLLPEARTLLASAVQRVTTDTAGEASVALAQLLSALGIVGAGAGVVSDAVEQLIFDPGALLRQRLAAAGTSLSSAAAALLGPMSAALDLAAHSLRVSGGSDLLGRFGWHVDVLATPTALSGELRFGATAPATPSGGLTLAVVLAPFRVALLWQQPGGALDTIELWPAPAAAAIARAVARAAPSLGAHAALEIMRRADEGARPIIDAALDALGLLAGSAAESERSLRPLAGLLADPAGWLRSAESLAASAGKIQALFDALRPLIGVGGAAGSALPLAAGVSLSVVAAGAGARLALDVDPTTWAAPNGAAGRLSAGLAASLAVGASGPPAPGLELHVGLTGAAPGRQAVHVRIGAGSGIELFLRPTSGADIPLVPFAGFGALAAAAQAALPFLLDRLADDDTVGPIVQQVGDAFGLRSGTPKAFDGALLQPWALNPAAALSAALPTILASGLDALAPLLDDFVPAAVSVSANTDTLSVAMGAVSLSWSPATGVVTLAGDGLNVPGIEQLSFVVGVGADGLDALSVTVGPAAIDAGGVILRPFVTVAAGASPAGERRVALGLAVDDAHRFAARWLFDSQQFALVASDGPLSTAVDSSDPVQVALRLVEVVADLVAAVALGQAAVQELLDTALGATTARNLLRGVVLADVADPAALIAGLFDPAPLLARIQRLFVNLAGAGIAITFEGLTLSFTESGSRLGLQLGLVERLALIKTDVLLWLENDDSWIDGNPPGDGGLFVGFVSKAAPLTFTPSLTVNGVGLRIGKSSGPLLDFGITLESIALHTFAVLDAGGAQSGGVQLQFSNLAVSAGGAKGDNGIAQGIMRDTGPEPPSPAFSPAFAVQKHGSGPVEVTLRAGDGDGPWWIAIQKGFGPLYLEQIGFAAKMPNGRVERVSVLMDGSVSMFGLTCAVDDLQITYIVANGDFFDPGNWAIDLAGLAVSADMAGVTISGGLLKQTTDQGIEYLGMLLGRFGVYGITIFGGYGEGVQNGQKFTAFFAVGAVNGPIGGPPAFFLTGIGGGFGINRRLVVPTDLSNFGDYPLIKALDVAAKPGKPMDELRALGAYFPMQKGTFWFAAGLSFNSFALVDGIAVVAVEIGDGLDINLLGLARMALPRPQVALVSIEVALLVRFSCSEGVLWVQGQLTDNSWLLYPDIKLTGGFAYVIWFKGEHAGEFVLTLGGYHPSFHRDGYPEVPRLGLRWSVGDSIVIKSGSYFALTSEALMAGGDFEVSADFGPAWAEVTFGAHGIVYFDPFHYDVSAYAHIAAGVTIDTWIFGEITISISVGARIEVTGPDFHGSVTFEVGPVELTVAFGGSDKALKQPLSAAEFIEKYLEPATVAGSAQAHAVMTAFGALPAKGEQSTPDGSAARPLVVVVEFGLTFTSTVPMTRVTRTLAATSATTQHAPNRALGVAPMFAGNLQPTLTLTWQRAGVAQPFPFVAKARPFGSFPVGVWGLAQDPNNRQVPKAEMIEALNELDLVARASESLGGPQIPYHQVEIGKRKPLPFTRRALEISTLRNTSTGIVGLLSEPATVAAAFESARTYLADRATPTALASLRGERQAPPLLGTLAERLDTSAAGVIPGIGTRPAGKVYDHFVDAPITVGILSNPALGLRTSSAARTTVKDSERAWRVPTPTLASVEALRSGSIAARLVLSEPAAVSSKVSGSRRHAAAGGGTVIGAVDVPPSAAARGAPAIVARTGAPGKEQLDEFNAGLSERRRGAREEAGASLGAGQIAVLKLPNAHADAALSGERPRLGLSGAPARVVVLGHGGVVMLDRTPRSAAADAPAAVEIAQGAERIVALGLGQAERSDANAGLSGWHAGMQLPYAGWSSAIAPGCVVRSSGERVRLHRERLDAGWVSGAELARGVSTVTTTFGAALTTVVVALDDPAAFGSEVAGRQLLLGLDGAERALDAAGQPRAPVLLATENRSLLAYDIVPAGTRPVVVTIASELGWSLVGVLGSAELSALGAISLISSRGLDAALRPLATAASGTSRLQWMGPTRSAPERRSARARASGPRALLALAPASAPARATPPRARPARKVAASKRGRS
jgi:large repetitive protein